MTTPAGIPRRRVIVFERSYDSSAEALGGVQRADELTATAQWRIEENADSCPVVHEGSGLRLSRAQVGAGDPIYRVFFTIDDTAGECHVWFVDHVPDPTVDADEDED